MFDRGPLYGITEQNFSDVSSDYWAFYEIEEASQKHGFLPHFEGGENLVK